MMPYGLAKQRGEPEMTNAKKDVVDLFDFAYNRLKNRLEGLTDDEYFWEPAPDVWTVRPGRDGKLVRDSGLIFDEDPPLTTIAWRMAEIFYILAAERCATLLGVEPEPDLFADGLPQAADAARDMLDRAYAMWRGYVEKTDEEALSEPTGPIAGQYAECSRLAFVLHIADEFIHHGAEVALMRDLYRSMQPQDPFVIACFRGDAAASDAMRRDDEGIVEKKKAEHPDLMLRAAATGRWDALPLLAGMGFSVDGRGGRGPLHHAAGAGRLDLVKLLIEAGADPGAKDPVYNATPAEWADYIRANIPWFAPASDLTEAAEYLRSL